MILFLAMLNVVPLTQRIVGKAEKFVSLTKQWLIALVQCWVDPEDLLNYNRAAIHHPGVLQHSSVWLPAATHTHTIPAGHNKILGSYSQQYPHKDCISASPLINHVHKCTHTHTHIKALSTGTLHTETLNSCRPQVCRFKIILGEMGLPGCVVLSDTDCLSLCLAVQSFCV